MGKVQSLALNTVIIAIGHLSNKLILFLLLPIYTRFLTPDEYGIADLIIIYINLLVPTFTAQMDMAVFRFLIDVRKDKIDCIRVITNAIYVAFRLFIPSLIIIVGAGLIINFQYTLIATVLILASLCFNLTTQIARGLGKNRQYATASILASILLIINTVVFVMMLKLGVYGLIISIALANLIAALFLSWQTELFQYINKKKINKHLQREMLQYALPLVPNGLAWWVINVSDRTIISVMLSVAANGVYATANKFSSIMTSVYSIFYMAWTESASLHIDSHDKNEFFTRVANLSMKIFGYIGLLLIAAMPILFPIMAGKEFTEAYNYIPILVLGVFLNVVVGIYSSIYVAKKLTRQVMNTSVVAGVINIIVSAGLMPLLGIWAAAIGTVIAFFAMAIYRHYDSKQFINISYNKGLLIRLSALLLVVLINYYSGKLMIQIGTLALVIIAAGLDNCVEIIKIKYLICRSCKK